MTKVLIVDDHPVVRDGMASMLNAGGGFEVATASDGERAIDFCMNRGEPDIVVMDVSMPKMNGFETIARLKRFFPQIKVLFVTGMPLRVDEEKARAAGAAGYLAKTVPWRRMVAALKVIASGEGGFVCDTFDEETKLLSSREKEVLEWMAQGKTRDEIGIMLSISPQTVKSHAQALMRKLDATNNASAISRAYELGILRA